ncbi:MAG: YciK family oxidoreductase [Xanthomonadaceae bacterium]|nr:YciK family oxidoreductase [Xanthomonadaceae bacterium]
MTPRSIPKRYRPAPDTLAGRVILITGASDGLGRATALLAAECGADLVLLGRNAKKLEAVADEIEKKGGKAPALHAMDFASATWPDYLALAHTLADKYGRLDGLLHNAGILGDRSPLLHYDVATWQQVMTVNVTAPFMLTRACLGLLGQSEDASVVFVSSGVGRKGYAHWGAYSVSKFALEGLSQILAEETAENTHIRANALNPGGVRTAMRAAAFPGEDRDRLPTPEDIAPAFIWMLGESSKGHTGETFDAQ